MKQWQRLLWVKQDYPDNYTDPDFLKQLRYHNLNEIKPLSTVAYKTIFKKNYYKCFKFFENLINISIMYIVYEYFLHTKKEFLFTKTVLLIVSLPSVVIISKMLESVKSTIIILFTILTLSPVIKSLSKTTSSDSIYNISFWLSVLNIVLLTTTSSQSKKKKSTNIIKINLILSNLIILASRLSSTVQVFMFSILAIQLNILIPFYFKRNVCYTLFEHLLVYYWIYHTQRKLQISVPIAIVVATLFMVAENLLILLSTYYLTYWQQTYYTRDNLLLDRWDVSKPILD
ncbi:hypothetical protein ACO0RG_002768 [Hanseniaspora osmophila]|uniref:Phosphatidylinositol N-acetylglucosaminyltransferase GPI2 subunit n=1 Tax=Hanseniaspora osmophila TaxID=56408 RepID=A0A1E5R861_9ASCO|nr:Phosphatidylinositol N-acetylglucosaminyltransferase GPI2 subunit [Hanseniaspora osmophila]